MSFHLDKTQKALARPRIQLDFILLGDKAQLVPEDLDPWINPQAQLEGMAQQPQIEYIYMSFGDQQ